MRQLEIERANETQKVALSLMTDFNLIDAFRLFDSDGTGSTDSDTLVKVLREFGLTVS